MASEATWEEHKNLLEAMATCFEASGERSECAAIREALRRADAAEEGRAGGPWRCFTCVPARPGEDTATVGLCETCGARADVRPVPAGAVHQTRIQAWEGHWQPRCSCGWEDSAYFDRADAVAAALRHGGYPAAAADRTSAAGETDHASEIVYAMKGWFNAMTRWREQGARTEDAFYANAIRAGENLEGAFRAALEADRSKR